MTKTIGNKKTSVKLLLIGIALFALQTLLAWAAYNIDIYDIGATTIQSWLIHHYSLSGWGPLPLLVSMLFILAGVVKLVNPNVSQSEHREA